MVDVPVVPAAINLIVLEVTKVLAIMVVESRKVLFDSVSVVALPIIVSVDVGNVSVPVFTIVEMTGDVKVLFVKVSVVVLPTRVSVVEGRVRVPLPLVI